MHPPRRPLPPCPTHRRKRSSALADVLEAAAFAALLIGFAAFPHAARAAEGAQAAAASPRTVTLKPQQRERLGIRTQAVQPAEDAGRVVLQGLVVLPPALVRVISAPVAAMVEQVRVARGDAVPAGAPLVTLDAPEVVAWQREYRQADLQLKLARQTAERDAALLAEGIIPASRAQASRNQLEIAQAAWRERGELLRMAGAGPQDGLSGRIALKAPGRGSVVEVMAEPGQRVDAGAPLVRFAGEGALAIELQAPAEVARRLRVGDAVRVPGCAEPARVSGINTQLEGGSQTVVLRALWPRPDPCALPGQRVQADVVLGARPGASGPPGWRVPSTAVLRHEGADVVFVQRPDGFAAQPVRIVSQQPAVGGLPATTQVDALPPGQIRPGDEVAVQGAIALKGMLQGLGTE
ncbi:MAG: efflux RND transporter periplasmic adaptor subunit [Variovorax sp.]|nr:efflux RND transporter periplasmic adaptor subunit [Variovorax sp.]